MNQLKELWGYLDRKRQLQLSILLVLMLLSSLLEIVSIGSAIPFLAAITSPEVVYQHHLIQPLVALLALTEPKQLVLILVTVFAALALVAGIMRLTLLYVMTKLSQEIGVDIRINIYKNTLYQDYSVHMARNNSLVIDGIITKTGTVVNGVIYPVLNMLNAAILLLGILITIIFINAVAILTLFGTLSLFYLVMTKYTRRKLKENSESVAVHSTRMVKSLQEGLGGIRDVLIDGTQQFYCSTYQNSEILVSRARIYNILVSNAPRFILEAVAMITVAFLAYIVTQQESSVAITIPVLGALALMLQRILPMSQKAYGAYTSIKGSKASFSDVLDLLRQALPDDLDIPTKAMVFEKEIKLEGLGFCHDENEIWVVKNINLEIKKGSCIGVIGKSGSGKSTLVDIIMGLLNPVIGTMSVDGQIINNNNRRSWQKNIAHVPQDIYLSDGTIEENIAFGIPSDQINYKRVREVADLAEISELLDSWEKGSKVSVGEKGSRLSGGQRQRIAIARALYKQVDVLIFDEATSALDVKTEEMIMNSVDNLKGNLTIFKVAHKISLLKNCDQIINLEEGK